MPERTDQPAGQPSPQTNAAPAAVPHHWIMTVQSADGRQGTSNGNIDVIPGVHTDEVTYSTVLNGMRQWIGSENITVLFYRLSPSALPRPAVTQ